MHQELKPQPIMQFSPSCLPYCVKWLAERGHPAIDPKALAQILAQSLGSYIDCYSKFAFYHRHDTHLIPSINATLGEQRDELHLPAMRTPTGWIVGSPDDFMPDEKYHKERLREELMSNPEFYADLTLGPNDK